MSSFPTEVTRQSLPAGSSLTIKNSVPNAVESTRKLPRSARSAGGTRRSDERTRLDLSRSRFPQIPPDIIRGSAAERSPAERFLVPLKLMHTSKYVSVSMPRCKNRSSFVTTACVRVFAPNDAEQPCVYPSCEDIVRDGAGVREARATRGN